MVPPGPNAVEKEEIEDPIKFVNPPTLLTNCAVEIYPEDPRPFVEETKLRASVVRIPLNVLFN